MPLSLIHIFCPDNTYGGYLAARHLLETGCRHLMTLTATADKSREFVERTAGFKQALREFEVPIEEAVILSGPMQSDWAYQTIMEHQQLLPKVDGIFAQTDLMAFGVDVYKRQEHHRAVRKGNLDPLLIEGFLDLQAQIAEHRVGRARVLGPDRGAQLQGGLAEIDQSGDHRRRAVGNLLGRSVVQLPLIHI